MVPSPDLISTVSIPRACARFAILPILPCAEWLMYQIHIPSPASGLFALAVSSVVWETAPPLSGPAASATSAAVASRA